MKRLIFIALMLLFTGCVGESVIVSDEVRVFEIEESISNDDYKYKVRLTTQTGWTFLYTNTYYKVGEKVQIIQKEDNGSK